MNTLHTVKNLGMAGLLTLSLPSYFYASSGMKTTGECNFTNTRITTLALVKAQKPSSVNAVDDCFLGVLSDWIEIMRIVDPTIEPGPIRADYHETFKSMVIEEFNVILRSHAERFTKLARSVGENSEAGKMLAKIAQALHDMGQVFVKHMAVCEELARKDKGAQYTREDGIAAATTLFRMQKLKKDLQPFVFLLPAGMNDLGFAQWQKIIATLY